MEMTQYYQSLLNVWIISSMQHQEPLGARAGRYTVLTDRVDRPASSFSNEPNVGLMDHDNSVAVRGDVEFPNIIAGS